MDIKGIGYLQYKGIYGFKFPQFMINHNTLLLVTVLVILHYSKNLRNILISWSLLNVIP